MSPFLESSASSGNNSSDHEPLDDAFTCRQMQAALLALNADLLSHDSATLTLERWSEARGLASPARVVAERQHGALNKRPAKLACLLEASPAEPIRHRRVHLYCGGRVLSEADNWYIPGRLTAEMNHRLDTTDVPFGRVVASLNFRRRTLSSRLLWSPLSIVRSSGGGTIPDRGAKSKTSHVLEHRAVLTLPTGKPFSYLIEAYTGAVLAVPEERPGASRAVNPSQLSVGSKWPEAAST